MSEKWAFIVKVVANEAVVEIVAHTRATVLLKIDPSTPWDRDALMNLSVALEGVAKRLRSNG